MKKRLTTADDSRFTNQATVSADVGVSADGSVLIRTGDLSI
jgi:hypothetical protein